MRFACLANTCAAFVVRCIWSARMPESSVLTLRLDPQLRRKLDRLSSAMSRSRSFIAAEAIREYVALNDWQITEIKKGMAEADRGDFASDSDFERTVRKWTGKRGR
jgi:RHH-type transcriptional regulator, rel operon repressor / antitoxin RelB